MHAGNMVQIVSFHFLYHSNEIIKIRIKMWHNIHLECTYSDLQKKIQTSITGSTAH
jgi:hypothetical protein